MSFHAWMAVVGGLLLIMALSSAYLRRLPVTTAAIYLIVGLILSPLGFGVASIDFVESKVWLEYLTEVAVIVSLFIGGLKLRLPLTDKAWTAAFRLAAPVMIASITGVAVFCHYALGLDWSLAFLIGALLAPTDPVLASTVAVDDATDRDRMRYGLSGEAGFNDGAAFPFVVFALLWMENGSLGSWIGGWALHRLVWAIPAGLLLGFFLGKFIGRVAIWLRTRHRDNTAPNDFLALSLIAISYVGAEMIYAWGFLAVFAAGLGLRRAEIKTTSENPLPEHRADSENSSELPPAEQVVAKNIEKEDLKKPTVAAGLVVSEVISFGNTAERIMEVLLVVLVGIALAVYWDWRAVPLALMLFFIIRPIFAFIFLQKTPTTKLQRILMGWFGIRGIGSIYYLSYALTHGLNAGAQDAIRLTLSVVALSIVIHGISAQPILDFYERSIKNK